MTRLRHIVAWLRRIPRARLWLAVQQLATLVLVVAVCVLAYYAFRTHEALCTLRHDLEQRHEAGVAFLETHPNGIQGISRSDLQRSLSAQESTLDSLSGLDCD